MLARNITTVGSSSPNAFFLNEPPKPARGAPKTDKAAYEEKERMVNIVYSLTSET